MRTPKSKREKNKRRKQSFLEAEFFRIMEKSLKEALNVALDDIFSNWKI